MNTLALEEKDPLFWASLEETLRKTPHEIEVIALDWLRETVIQTIQRNPLFIIQPADNPLTIGTLNEGCEHLVTEYAFRRSHLKPYLTKPRSLEELKDAIRIITGAPDDHITHCATHLIRRLAFHTRRGRFIIRRSGSTFIQMTDSRFPFPSMQQRIER